jgi:O-antigen/teichoic acid export membrane protein
MDNIKDKTISGLTWSAIDNVASQGITFIIGIILARLLSPEEFGTLGIAMIFVGLFNQIVDCGFSNALIRKKRVDDIDYNTTFIFNLVLSLFLYFLCFFITPYISYFFNKEGLIPVLRWLSLVVIINAVGIIQKTILIRRIDFKTQTKISIISSVSSGVIGIIAAVYGCGVMSLVYQQLSRQGLNTLFLWIYNKWRPQLAFSLAKFKELFSFGSKLLLSGLIDYAFNDSASIVIGKIYSPATLGQYSRAKQFSSIFSSNLSSVVQRVTFPVLAQYVEDKESLVLKYKTIVKSLMLVSGFFMMTLACTAKPVILILVGEKWTEAIIYLQIICFNDMLYPIKQVNINAIQVSGRSDLVLKVTIIKRILQAIPIILGIFNIYYMLYGLVIASVLGLVLNAFFASKCIPYSLPSQLRDLSRPFLFCVIPAVAMFVLSFLDINIYLLFLLQISAGGTILMLLVHLKRLPEYYYVLDVARTVVGKVNVFKQ